MNAIATKFQVTTAAVAVAAAAAFTPVAASAAPAVTIPAAPAVIQDVAQAPGDFIYGFQVFSLQVAGSVIRFRSFQLDTRAQRLEAYATLHPDTFFGKLAAAQAVKLRERRAFYGNISFSACRNGTGVVLGSYGTITAGPC